MKPITWLGDSLERIRAFPEAPRQAIGRQLELVQRGRPPLRWKPMPSVGLGVNELKVKVEGEFRAIYVAKFADAVYVLHAFQKKSQKTSRLDIELARQRYKVVVAAERRQR